MSTTTAHYDELLGAIYTWMVGDLEAAWTRSAASLAALGVVAGNGTAVDLGCGFGLQSIPLSRLGYSVVAIDSCERLLEELRARSGGLDVRPVRGDLLRFREHLRAPAELIVCMGDTLTHLASWDDVARLVREIAAALASGGMLVLTFRDYVENVPSGTKRFIPVRSDEGRILTCFLEFEPAIVRVHDIVHERVNGTWQLRVGCYPKLRIDRNALARELELAGLTVRRNELERGLVSVVASKG